MLNRQKLFWLSRVYDLPGSDARFLRAVRDNCAYHMRHCPEYRLICETEGFSPGCLNTIDDLEKIPAAAPWESPRKYSPSRSPPG